MADPGVSRELQRYDQSGLEALAFAAEGDMRNALNGAQPQPQSRKAEELRWLSFKGQQMFRRRCQLEAVFRISQAWEERDCLQERKPIPRQLGRASPS